MALHARVLAALAGLDGRDGHVFRSSRRSQDGQRLSYDDTRNYKPPGGNPLRRTHATACRKAGICGYRIHDWRHHWASSCVMAGEMDLIAVMANAPISTLIVFSSWLFAAVMTWLEWIDRPKK